MAQALLEILIGTPVLSAGIKVAEENWKYGHTPTMKVVQSLAEVAIDVSYFEVKQLEPHLLEGVELIIVFCDQEICPPSTFGDTTAKILYQFIDDPRSKDLGVFRETRDQIERYLLEMYALGIFHLYDENTVKSATDLDLCHN